LSFLFIKERYVYLCGTSCLCVHYSVTFLSKGCIFIKLDVNIVELEAI
jgi:hypothetical protein